MSLIAKIKSHENKYQLPVLKGILFVDVHMIKRAKSCALHNYMVSFQDLNGAGCVHHKPMAEFFDSAFTEVFQGKKSKREIRIMDAGAGTGLLGVELHKLGYANIDALDISQGMLNEAKKTNVYQNFICAPINDQRTPGVETDEYDALVCLGTLVFAHVRPAAIVEIIRMVRNGECCPP